MTLRYYTSLDTGAPVLTGTTYYRLRAILMACLVTGYGSKAAAGWSMPHDVTGGCSFSNGDAVLNLVSTASDKVQFYSMEYITDPSTALAGGYNRRSGRWADNASTDRQILYDYYLFSTSYNPHWFVVADNKTCILVLGSSSDGSANTYRATAIYFGRYQNTQGLTGAAEWCSIGPTYNSTISIGSQWFMWADGQNGSRAGTLLRHPVTGLVFPDGNTFVGASSAAPRAANGGMKLTALSRICLTRTPILLWDGSFNGPFGYLRGVLQDMNLCSSSLPDVLAAFGQPNTWQQRVTPLTLPGGKQVLPYWPYNTSDSAYFISLDAADWGDL